MKCKREGCKNEGIDYAGYAGCCSLYCRDVHEQDEELAALRAENEQLKAENRDIKERMTAERHITWPKIEAMQGVVDAARAHNDVCDSLYDEALATAIMKYDALNGEEG